MTILVYFSAATACRFHEPLGYLTNEPCFSPTLFIDIFFHNWLQEQFSLTERDLRPIDNNSYEFLVSDLITIARAKYGSKSALQARLDDKQRQKNIREATKQCGLVERERQVVGALEEQKSSFKDIAGVDARCMPFVSTPMNYQHAPQQSAEDAAKWLIAWKNRQETRHKSLLVEISARASRCKGCRARYDYR